MPWSQNTLKLSVCSECKHNFTGYIQSLKHKNGFNQHSQIKSH
jgi:hypothetical protein